jgi:hypothetical protein
MPAEPRILLSNGSSQTRHFVLYQRSRVLEPARGDGGWFPFVWATRSLRPRARWDTRLPMTFQVAGMLEVEGSRSTTNVEDADYGQHWVMQQAPDEEFYLERLPDTGPSDRLQIQNAVAFARRTALILKSGRELLGAELDAGDDISLAIEPSLHVGVAIEPLAEGERLDPSSLQYTWPLSYAESSSTREWYAELRESGGALELQVIPRARVKLASFPP